MEMTVTERNMLDEAQDVGAVLNAVAGMRVTRHGSMSEDWDPDQYRPALSRCPAGRRVVLFDFTPRCLWCVQVYDNCRLIDGDFLRKQDEILAWLGVHYPGTEANKRTAMWMYYASFANSAYLRRCRVDIERQQKHA
jgi:hypothetical protein